jgi:hypothetical protein
VKTDVGVNIKPIDIIEFGCFRLAKIVRLLVGQRFVIFEVLCFVSVAASYLCM